jgi:hypothetical protein
MTISTWHINLRIHHHEEFDAVVVTNSKGLSLPTFNTHRQEPCVCVLLNNSSRRGSADNSPTTTDATPNAGNADGATLHEDSNADADAP